MQIERSVLPQNTILIKEKSMRDFIFKILGIQSLITRSYQKGRAECLSEIKNNQEVEKFRKVELNYPVGQEVIVVGNSPSLRTNDSVLVATVVGYDEMGSNIFPILENSKKEKFMTMGKIIPFDQNRYNTLKKLTWWEQWNAVSVWGPSIDAQSAKNLEEGRPAWDNGEKGVQS